MPHRLRLWLLGAVATVALAIGLTGCLPSASGGACTVHCTVGKPCGNSCINANDTCHQPPGSACYGTTGDPRFQFTINLQPAGTTCTVPTGA